LIGHVRFGAEADAGSPARQRGNFLLLRQKKVTKEEAPNAIRNPLGECVWRPHMHRGEPLRSRGGLVTSPIHWTFALVKARLHAGARENS
jgi:hypothetical protein